MELLCCHCRKVSNIEAGKKSYICPHCHEKTHNLRYQAVFMSNGKITRSITGYYHTDVYEMIQEAFFGIEIVRLSSHEHVMKCGNMPLNIIIAPLPFECGFPRILPTKNPTD